MSAAVLATLRERFLASLIDGLLCVVFPLLILCGFALADLPALFYDPAAFNRCPPCTILRTAGERGFLIVALYLIALAVVQSWSIHQHAATIGKRALSLQVLRHSRATPCGLLRYTLLRIAPVYAVALMVTMALSGLWAIGQGNIWWPLACGSMVVLLDTLPIVTPERRCGHDRIADTVVVKR